MVSTVTPQAAGSSGGLYVTVLVAAVAGYVLFGVEGLMVGAVGTLALAFFVFSHLGL